MSGVVLALAELVVAFIEVIGLVALLLAVVVVAYGVALGIRRSRPSSDTADYDGYFRPGTPERLGAVGVPRQLGLAKESTLGGRLTFERAVEFDGHAVGERLDRDVPGCDR